MCYSWGLLERCTRRKIELRTRVKICGITRPKDARISSDLGADAIGLVFYARSARAVSPALARQILRVKAPFVTAVGLFLDANSAYIRDIVDSVPLDVLQFHGDERPAVCGSYGKPYIKAIPMGAEVNVKVYAETYPDATGYLLDSHMVGEAGGSGASFDWKKWPSSVDKPLILAGGLNPSNVREAVLTTRPYAVDVSSGVETEKGIKDKKKLAEFINEVHRVNCSQN